MFMFRLATAFVAIFLMSACGSTSATKSTSTTTPRTAEVLFAVVENGSPYAPETVAIVGLDGKARATADFQPRVSPIIPDAYTPLQSVARVVGSGIYYIDGTGVVRVLRVGENPQIVARFSLQAAQENVWFAVSPDGSRVLAGILTFPALGPIISGTSWNKLIGPTTFDLETAPAGGQSTTVLHWETPLRFPRGSSGPTAIFPVEWNSAGSVAMLPEDLTSQNYWRGGPLYVINDSGKQSRQLGGSDCFSASMTPTGLIPCISGQSVEVRNQGGSVIWTTHVESLSALSLHLSPDGQAISDGIHVETNVGGMIAMPKGFLVEGWLDKDTVVGRLITDDVSAGDLAWVSLGNPSAVHDLGFKADFVSTLG